MAFHELLLNTDRVQVMRMVALLERLTEPTFRKERVLQLVEQCPYLAMTAYSDRLKRLNNGWFDIENFILLFEKDIQNQNYENKSNSSSVWLALLKQLAHHGLVINTWYSRNGPEYQLQDDMFKTHRVARILEFSVFGLKYIIEKTKFSIPAINIKTKNLDMNCGTGVLVKLPSGYNILTNRHVVENNTIENVKAGEVNYNILGEPILCDFADLALLPVNGPPNVHVLSMTHDPKVLEAVVSIGYPLVATASDQYALAHKGEINGTLVDQKGRKFLTISNHVGPGNSGGPILNEKGEIVGLIAQSGIGEFGTADTTAGTYRSVYHMAIPPSTIIEFVREADTGR